MAAERGEDTSRAALIEQAEALRRRVTELEAAEVRLKRQEEALRESENKYRALVQQTPDGVCICDDGRIIFSNEAHWRMLAFRSEQEMLGTDVCELIAPEAREMMRDRVARRLRGEDVPSHYEVKSHRRDGSTFDSEVMATRMMLGGRPVVQVVLRDVTERKRVEAAVRQEIEELFAIFNGVEGAVYVADLETYEILAVNRYVERDCGPELLGRKCYETFQKGQAAPCPFCTNPLLVGSDGTPNPPVVWEFQNTRSGRWYQCIDRAIHWPDGHLVRMEIAIDITDRKRVEDALREGERRYRAVVEDQTELICRFQPGGTLTFVNGAYCRYFGKTPEELIGHSFMPLIPDEDQERVGRGIEGLGPQKPVMTHEHRVVLPDGDIRWQQWTNRAILDSEGRLVEFQAVGRDITEKRKLEEELAKMQKLESLALFASGIAHDFNNILTGILGNISLAKTGVDRADETYEVLTDAERAALRAKSLTQQLLTFSRGGSPARRVASLADLLEETAEFALVGSKSQSACETADDLWPAPIDAGQISQVIQNLVLNADQAMPQGGVVRLRAENATVGPDAGLPLPPGRYVKIGVEDQGIGIPKEHLPKIFDPYFTTKQRGSGLGLSISYSIVKKHGGHIAVESLLGVGSRFEVYLPAAAEGRTIEQRDTDQPAQGQGRVLLMDDEDIVRKVAGKLLRYLGYEVVYARDGAEALALYRKAMGGARPFDAAILDLTVPGGMGGRECLQKLLEIDPGARAIVSSGYPSEPAIAEWAQHGFRGVVAKPYRLEELSEALRLALS